MAKFAIYYVPPADSKLYQRGSEILGYDVRAGQFLPEQNPTRTALPEFDVAWIAQPQTYGFHMTVGYSLYFDMAQLAAIEHEMLHVFACFGRDIQFQLKPAIDEWIPFWREEIVVLHYEPNPAMLMLHTMIIARINPFGTGSNLSKAYEQKSSEELDPVLKQRVKQYHTPYMLDGWVPHFSLMYPYTGEHPQQMKRTLLDLFPPQPLAVESICLLIRDDAETHYRLYREFHIADFP